jgi:hypothetical protein
LGGLELVEADALKNTVLVSLITLHTAVDESLRQLPGMRHVHRTEIEMDFPTVVQCCSCAVFSGLFTGRVVAKSGL